jgi:hypothetical protein
VLQAPQETTDSLKLVNEAINILEERQRKGKEHTYKEKERGGGEGKGEKKQAGSSGKDYCLLSFLNDTDHTENMLFFYCCVFVAVASCD